MSVSVSVSLSVSLSVYVYVSVSLCLAIAGTDDSPNRGNTVDLIARKTGLATMCLCLCLCLCLSVARKEDAFYRGTTASLIAGPFNIASKTSLATCLCLSSLQASRTRSSEATSAA